MSYGVEVWCTDSRVCGRYARGRVLVAQALYRRLITPRGTLRGGDEERAYGLDVAGYVGAVGIRTAVAALPGLVRGELLKDDRVADVQVTATAEERTDGTAAVTLEMSVLLLDEDESFTLTLSASALTLDVIGGAS